VWGVSLLSLSGVARECYEIYRGILPFLLSRLQPSIILVTMKLALKKFLEFL